MAPIYSKKLVNAVYPTPYSAVVYTVPPGTTVVVTDIDFLTSGSAAQYFIVQVGSADLIWIQRVATGTDTHQWRGKQVLNAGDTITLTNGNVATLAITGYVLS
jgi:hypothetical protein